MKQTHSFVSITLADLIARSAYQMGKTPLLPIFAANLGVTGVFLGFIVSVSTITGMVLKPFIGILSDRWGRRAWLFIGTTFFAVMPFCYSLIHTPEQLLVIRLVHGMATAIYGPVTVAYVAEQNHQRRAERLGWFGMARSAGYIIGPAAAGGLLLIVEPVQVFTIIGLMSSLVFLPILLLPEVTPPTSKQQSSFGRQAVEALKIGSQTPVVWLSGGLEAMMFISLYAIKAFLPVQATSVGMSVALVGVFFSVQEAVYMLLKPFGGWIGDRQGYFKTISLGMVLLGLTVPLLTLSQAAGSLLILSALMGIAQALVFPSTIALVSMQIHPQHLGAGMGLIGTFKNGGKIAGPILGGILLQRFNFALTLKLMGSMLLLAAFLVAFSSQRTQKKT